MAQERRTPVARIHALKALHGAAIVACCAALVAHAARALAALGRTTQRAIARWRGYVHFKREEEGRENFFFIERESKVFFDGGAEHECKELA